MTDNQFTSQFQLTTVHVYRVDRARLELLRKEHPALELRKVSVAEVIHELLEQQAKQNVKLWPGAK